MVESIWWSKLVGIADSHQLSNEFRGSFLWFSLVISITYKYISCTIKFVTKRILYKKIKQKIVILSAKTGCWKGHQGHQASAASVVALKICRLEQSCNFTVMESQRWRPVTDLSIRSRYSGCWWDWSSDKILHGLCQQYKTYYTRRNKYDSRCNHGVSMD